VQESESPRAEVWEYEMVLELARGLVEKLATEMVHQLEPGLGYELGAESVDRLVRG
jgi:hypothetical protein